MWALIALVAGMLVTTIVFVINREAFPKGVRLLKAVGCGAAVTAFVGFVLYLNLPS